jgi:hypothetical protein
MGDMDFLLSWFIEHCDGSWEHEKGVIIESLDNPGWRLQVQIRGTELDGFQSERQIIATGSSWLHWWSTGELFHAACGPSDLPLALRAFEDFARTNGQSEPSI